jgi:DNA-binding MarR family transcriptional regulator
MGMPLEERLGTDIRRVHQELMAVKHAALRVVGLTVPQYSAMYFLSGAPGVSGAELARQCLVTPQTMTTVLRNLETAGLIERHPHRWHRNVIETHLTATGRRALSTADEVASAIERRLADRFTSTERDTLRSLLARCSDELPAAAAADDSPGGRPATTAQ